MILFRIENMTTIILKVMDKKLSGLLDGEVTASDGTATVKLKQMAMLIFRKSILMGFLK